MIRSSYYLRSVSSLVINVLQKLLIILLAYFDFLNVQSLPFKMPMKGSTNPNFLVKVFLVLVGFFAQLEMSYGQTAQAVFGRNRIQHSVPNWQFITSNNFDIYYTEGSEAYARRSARIAEQEFSRITELIGYSPYNRIRIFLYNSPDALGQSNIGLEPGASILGGRTSFVKNIIEVAYPGSQSELRTELAMGLSRAMIYDMMYGGSFTEALQNSYLMMLPEWFTEGSIAFAAEGWSARADDYARDAVQHGQIKRLASRKGIDAMRLGQSFWVFVQERYGRSNISNILNLTRIIRNEESAVSSTLGVGYSKLMKEWKEYYQNQLEQAELSHTVVPKDLLIRTRHVAGEQLQTCALSPNGMELVWGSQDEGRLYVRYKNLETGKQYLLFKQGERHVDSKTLPYTPVAWVGSDRIATVHYRRGKAELLILSTTGKRVDRFTLTDIDQVNGIAISKDGKIALLTGSSNGQTDIYQVSLQSGKLRGLTNSVDDERDLVISDQNSTVYFSANKAGIQDTAKGIRGKKGSQYGLYKLSIKGINQPVLLTKGVGNFTYPQFRNGELVAIWDGSGINELVTVEDSGRKLTPLTSIQQSFEGIQLSTKVSVDEKSLIGIGIVRVNLRHRIILLDTSLLPDEENKEPTGWRLRFPMVSEQENAGLPPLTVLKNSVAMEPGKNIEGVNTTTSTGESVSNLNGNRNIKADGNDKDEDGNGDEQEGNENETSEDRDSKQAVPIVPQVVVDPDKERVDINNYIFESEKQAPLIAPVPYGNSTNGSYGAAGAATRPGSSFANTPGLPPTVRRQLLQTELVVPPVSLRGPFPSLLRLSSTNVVSTTTIDPIRGWGVVVEVGLSDYFNNHRFNFRAIPYLENLRSSLLEFEYQYLKHRVDFGAHFSKNTLFLVFNSAERNTLYRYEGHASYPLSKAARISFSPFYAQTNYIRLGEPSVGGLNKDKFRSYAGTKSEFVYDNTVTSTSNIITGSRMRAIVENFASIRGPGRSFGSVFIDLRRYQKVHKEITLALRASGGRFFGKAKKQYIMGGMDNWIFNDFVDNSVEGLPSDDPIFGNANISEGHVDYLLNPFVTNLRGFKYNTIYGNNFLLFNAELRIPLIKYLYKGPIVSNFLRNFQIVGFFDAGSAWSGGSLLDKTNSINQKVVRRKPITVTTFNYRNPFLVGYGSGIRTMLLGYYAKFDVAWGQQDYTSVNRVYYLTLGYDF
jgi:hypothetical protein